MCEGINDNIKNKNIILIDELVLSGRTINKSIEYLLNKEVKEIYPVSIIAKNDVKLVNNYKLNSLIKDNYAIVWPWGYDN